jgi:sugar lactone lactonase YvrE
MLPFKPLCGFISSVPKTNHMKTRLHLFPLAICILFIGLTAQAQSVYEPYDVATIAGLAGVVGYANGVGSTARFNYPIGVAVDTAGNCYVADRDNNAIRKITPNGAVTTLAGSGSYYIRGSSDGTGSSALFSQPYGVAVDTAGYVYVADFNNNLIRKISPSGAVTTLAGLAGPYGYGSSDGIGDAARFRGPWGIAVDSAGNVYVGDYGNATVRKITPAGVVSTLAGSAGSFGYGDGIGRAALFHEPAGVAVDANGNVYVADVFNFAIRKISSTGVVTTLAGLPNYPPRSKSWR